MEKALKKYIVKRDDSTCQRCGKTVEKQNCHLSHVLSRRGNPHLKYDENNVKILCYYCHINWWHKEPLEARDWFSEKFPKRYKYLMEEKNKVKKNIDLNELLERYSK